MRPSGDEGGYWAHTVLDQFENLGCNLRIGSQTDDAFHIKPGEFALIFSTDPSAAFGDDVVCKQIYDNLTFDMVAVYLRIRVDATVRTFISILHQAAKQLGL